MQCCPGGGASAASAQKELGFEQTQPTIILEDNQGCIALSENPIHHKRTKHIDVRYHYIREKLEDKTVRLQHIPTADNTADILTKPLGATKFRKHRDELLTR